MISGISKSSLRALLLTIVLSVIKLLLPNGHGAGAGGKVIRGTVAGGKVIRGTVAGGKVIRGTVTGGKVTVGTVIGSVGSVGIVIGSVIGGRVGRVGNVTSHELSS